MSDPAEFHVAQLIRTAATAEERARILLRLPDSIMLEQTYALRRACDDHQFDLGRAYLDVRVATLCAMRGPAGILPWDKTVQLAFYQELMCSLAGVAQ